MVIPYEYSLKIFKSGTVLYASPMQDDSGKEVFDAVEDAILFCRENELTQEDVRIVKTYKEDENNKKINDMVLVIRK
jgi:hypothetical protein